MFDFRGADESGLYARAYRTSSDNCRRLQVILTSESGSTKGYTSDAYMLYPSSYYSDSYDYIYHYAIVYDRQARTLGMYRNGRLIQQWTGVVDYRCNTTGDLLIGNTENGIGLVGVMDEFSIYNRPLTPIEIAAISGSGPTGKAALVENVSPDVDAGDDLYVDSGVPIQVQLSGSFNDPDVDDAHTIRWSVVSGPDGGASLVSGIDTLTPEYQFTEAGLYVLELSVSDGSHMAKDRVEVRVDLPSTVDAPLGLVGWWPGNDTTEERVNQNDGWFCYNSDIRSPHYGLGQVGNGFYFDGSNYVRVPASEAIDVGASEEGFTVDFWLRHEFGDGSAGQNKYLFYFQGAGDYGLCARTYYYSNNHDARLRVYLKDVNGSYREYTSSTYMILPSTDFSPDYAFAYHYAIVYNREAETLGLYRNGALIVEWSDVGDFRCDTQGDLLIGNTENGQGLVGMMDEFSLYNRPLNQGELASIYAAGAGGKSVNGLDNASPVLYIGNDQTLTWPDNQVSYSPYYWDDQGVPSAQWSVAQAPEGETVTFDHETQFDTTVTFSGVGSYVLALTASDGELSTTKEVSVLVRPAQTSPSTGPTGAIEQSYSISLMDVPDAQIYYYLDYGLTGEVPDPSAFILYEGGAALTLSRSADLYFFTKTDAISFDQVEVSDAYRYIVESRRGAGMDCWAGTTQRLTLIWA